MTGTVPARPGAFAELLLRHRTGVSLRQRDLAARCGLSERAIRDLERGVRTPRPHTARAVASALSLAGDGLTAFLAAARPGAAQAAPPPRLTATDDLVGRDRELRTLPGHPTRDLDEIADTPQTHAWYLVKRAPTAAAALLGAGDRIRRRPIAPAIQTLRDHAATAARSALGTGRFDAGYRAGATLDTDGLLDLYDRIAPVPRMHRAVPHASNPIEPGR
jgi:transcriptional regulator with XRE-family HTH domain